MRDLKSIATTILAAASKAKDVVTVPKPAAGAGSHTHECPFVAKLREVTSRGFPNGFKDKNQFKQAMTELKSQLGKCGFDDAQVGVRGSAVTGMSSKGGPFRDRGQRLPSGEHAGPSDVDVYFESAKISKRFKRSTKIPGMVSDKKIRRACQAAAEWSGKWSEKLGRNVAPAGFDPGKVPPKGRLPFKG
jgi:hypothetical protein